MIAETDFDARAIVFDIPLYDPIQLTKKTQSSYVNMFNAETTKVDGHCPSCGRESVFHSRALFSSVVFNLESVKGIRRAEFSCVRNAEHKIIVFFEMNLVEVDKEQRVLVRKVGQVPTHADIANGGLKEFTRVLEKDDRSEMIRANGLAAHGVNIGAFVYLRRVFERLIWRAKSRLKEAPDDTTFQKMRMDEKISALADVLPNFLTTNKKVYSVLSKGIHELDEATCGKHYELMKMSIFLMLDQEREIREREERELSLSRLISGLDV